jgi:hypothetical protein
MELVIRTYRKAKEDIASQNRSWTYFIRNLWRDQKESHFIPKITRGKHNFI